MKRIILSSLIILSVAFFNIEANDFSGRRHKRDDESYINNVGGPVAQSGKDEAGGKSDFGEAGGVIDKLNKCEMEEQMKKNGRKGRKSRKKGRKFSRRGGKRKEARGMLKHPGGSKDGGLPQMPGQDEIQKEFQKFKQDHNKQYSNPAEQAAAMKTFGENLTKMKKMNFGRRSKYDATFSMTKHSDMNLLDFVKKLSGALPDIDFVPQILDPRLLMKKRDCKKVHWQKFGVIPDVHLQENCGCCYAHSAADLIAAQYQIDRKQWDKPLQLSPQYLTDCMPEPKAYKCKGGRSNDMLNYLAQCDECSIPLESSYPYLDKEQACTSKSAASDDSPKIKIKWAQSFDISGPPGTTVEQDLMAALLQHGPVVAVVGITENWQMYNGSGILKFGQCTMKQMHAVLITGYNYENCVPTYWIKNSWGEDWGGRGSIIIEAGKNTCSVAKTVIALCTADDCPTNKADYLNYLLSKSNYPDCPD